MLAPTGKIPVKSIFFSTVNNSVEAPARAEAFSARNQSASPKNTHTAGMKKGLNSKSMGIIDIQVPKSQKSPAHYSQYSITRLNKQSECFEPVFKVTSNKPTETSSTKAKVTLNSLNSFDTFLKKDPVKKQLFRNYKKINRDLTKAYLKQGSKQNKSVESPRVATTSVSIADNSICQDDIDTQSRISNLFGRMSRPPILKKSTLKQKPVEDQGSKILNYQYQERPNTESNVGFRQKAREKK